MDRRRSSAHRGAKFCLVGSMLLLSAGCGTHADSHSGSQVVAKVGDDEITQMQLAQRLYGIPNPTEAERSGALDSLINESILVQAALKAKLDRDPAVIGALENSRRKVLADAYLETSVLPKSDVAPADIAAYYDANPALFAHHRTIVFALFTISGKDLSPTIEQQLASGQSQQKLSELLNGSKTPFELSTVILPSEQVPLEQLKTFSQIAVGDVVIRDKGEARTRLLVATDVREDARGLPESEPQIKTYLTNLHRKEAAEAYVKQARAAANVDDRLSANRAATAAPASTVQSPDTQKAATVNDTIASGIK